MVSRGNAARVGRGYAQRWLSSQSQTRSFNEGLVSRLSPHLLASAGSGEHFEMPWFGIKRITYIDVKEQKCYDRAVSVNDDAQVDEASTLRSTADGTPTAVRG